MNISFPGEKQWTLKLCHPFSFFYLKVSKLACWYSSRNQCYTKNELFRCNKASLMAQQVKNPWKRKSLPTPVFLPGQMSLVDHSAKGYKELDMTEHTLWVSIVIIHDVQIWLRTYRIYYHVFISGIWAVKE